MQKLNIWPQSLPRHSPVNGGFNSLPGQQLMEQVQDVVVTPPSENEAFTAVIEHVVANLFLLATSPATFVTEETEDPKSP